MGRKRKLGCGGYVLIAFVALAYAVGWKTVLAVVVAVIVLLVVFFYVREQDQRKRLLGASMFELDGLSGKQFEEWVIAHLTAHGFSARHVGGSGDFGLDVIASIGATRFGIQSKRYASNVGNRAVQEAIAGASYYDCDRAVVVTQSRFTRAAKKQAQAASPPVVLIGRSKLSRLADILRAEASG